MLETNVQHRNSNHYNSDLKLENNSLKWGADLPTELPSAVCGVDHLPGVTLGPCCKKTIYICFFMGVYLRHANQTAVLFPYRESPLQYNQGWRE